MKGHILILLTFTGNVECVYCSVSTFILDTWEIITLENSEYLDDMPQKMASHQGLHWLLG